MLDPDYATRVFKANFPNGLPPFNESAIRADERSRVLDELARWAAPRYWDNDEDKANLEEWIQGMRREGEQ